MKCSPKIWKKFDKRQKLLWKAFYNRFRAELRTSNGVGGRPYMSRPQNDVIAHNLACEAVWVEAKELELYE